MEIDRGIPRGPCIVEGCAVGAKAIIIPRSCFPTEIARPKSGFHEISPFPGAPVWPFSSTEEFPAVSLKTICCGAIVLSLTFCAQFAHAAGPVARVNGADITEAELNFAEAEVGAEIAGLPVEARR